MRRTGRASSAGFPILALWVSQRFAETAQMSVSDLILSREMPSLTKSNGPCPIRPSRMTRQIVQYIRVFLCAVLAVAMALSSNSRIVAHDYTELVQIVADHKAEIEHHGHAHDDIVDLIHAYQGHVHETADHDHNIAFLPPRDVPGERVPTAETWLMAAGTWPDRSANGLDRPPRV